MPIVLLVDAARFSLTISGDARRTVEATVIKKRMAVDVFLPRQAWPGIRVHHVKLETDDVILWEGFKMTTVARTIADVARTHYDEPQIDLAIQQALLQGLTTKEKMIAQAERSTIKVKQLIHSAMAKVPL